MARLRRTRREQLAIARQRRGRGFVYVGPDGGVISGAEFRDRARLLGIPPAWQDVRLTADPLGHIQACGVDAAGRLQYIYHADWEARRTRKKQQQLALLTEALPRIRRHVHEDLSAEAGSRELALAIGVALIDRTAMRVGRERYLDAHGTRGAGTLFSRDVLLDGEVVGVTFPAKSGKRASYALRDPLLADAIGRVKTIPGRRLLMYRDAEGEPRAIRTEQINGYLRELAGTAVTAKDFRTLHASALAGDALAKLEPGESVSARKRQLAQVTRQVAAFLHNTPAISRKCYIAPCLFSLFEAGRLAAAWMEGGERRDGLRAREVRLAAVLAAAG
jgi:DNA topoisomerase-1